MLELLERQYVNGKEGDFHMPVKESKELMNTQYFTTMATESQMKTDFELCFHVSTVKQFLKIMIRLKDSKSVIYFQYSKILYYFTILQLQ